MILSHTCWFCHLYIEPVQTAEIWSYIWWIWRCILICPWTRMTWIFTCNYILTDTAEMIREGFTLKKVITPSLVQLPGYKLAWILLCCYIYQAPQRNASCFAAVLFPVFFFFFPSRLLLELTEWPLLLGPRLNLTNSLWHWPIASSEFYRQSTVLTRFSKPDCVYVTLVSSCSDLSRI